VQFEFVSDEARSEDVILDDLCHSEDTSDTGQSPKGGPVERRKSERQDQAAEDPQIGNDPDDAGNQPDGCPQRNSKEQETGGVNSRHDQGHQKAALNVAPRDSSDLIQQTAALRPVLLRQVGLEQCTEVVHVEQQIKDEERHNHQADR
jgi:hypothetical protein